LPELIERGYIYIAQPPLYKVKSGKKEQYLKDEHALKEFLLSQALSDAALVPAEGAAPIMGEALENLAREYFLAEAVIDRLTRILPEEVLHALMHIPALSLADSTQAMMAEAALASQLSGSAYSVETEFVPETEMHRLKVTRNLHGNIIVNFLEEDLLDSGDYAQLTKTGELLRGLIGSGASIARGEKAAGIQSFKEAMEWLLNEVKRNLGIQRYKGLGEMNPEQLWETTMDPKVRRLMRVRIEDLISTGEIFSTLMGDEVEPRRAFIETNALGVRNLDV
jgi:DNA gyrase subunit B